MSRTALSPKESEAIMKQKLADLKEDLGNEQSNFKSSFVLEMPRSPIVENVDNDPVRERAFEVIAHECLSQSRDLLQSCNLQFKRAPSTLAELDAEEQVLPTRVALKDKDKKKSGSGQKRK